MEADLVLVSILDGISRGCLYFLIASGLTLVLGIMGIINFAHGTFLMLGAFLAWWLADVLHGVVGSYWIAAIIAVIGVGTFGMLLERFLIRRLYKADIIYQLLFFFGIILFMDGFVQKIWGTSPKILTAPAYLKGAVYLFGQPVSKYSLFVLFFSLAVGGLIWLLLYRTRIGRSFRAVSQDKEVASSLGINVELISTLFFGIGVALAVLGGSIGMYPRPVSPAIAIDLLIIAFVVIVIGGMGSLTGTLVAALIIGVVDSMSGLFMEEMRFILPYAVMAVVLIFRPEGLFARR